MNNNKKACTIQTVRIFYSSVSKNVHCTSCEAWFSMSTKSC